MVYNEDVFLPLWARYYGRQFGETSCYVIDHGSDDHVTAGLGKINIVRIPRSPMHDGKRANFISNFCSALFEWYDAVVYCDVDEFLVADPADYGSLPELIETMAPGSTLTAIGLEVIHAPDADAPIDLAAPILGQRRWARFSFAMCKPLLTTTPIRWVPGFHSSDQPTVFGRLFLFHLHHFDLNLSLKRLAKTRTMPWGDGPPDHYQRWPDEKLEQMHRSIAGLPKVEMSSFGDDDTVIGPYLAWIERFMSENPDRRHVFYFNNGIDCAELLAIPERFWGMI